MSIIPAEDREEWMVRQACERPPAQRRAFLESSCAGDTSLLQRVIELMRAKEIADAKEQATIVDLDALRQRVAEGLPSPQADGVVGNTVESDRSQSPASGSSCDITQISVVNSRPSKAGPFLSARVAGDYELLEEIARGGMGVVYKARQESLNRVVAVKMILAGKLADEREIKRFRIEAEAAANLQHPNIVAIHEIGEYEGQPFFSMAFVDGRNLGQILQERPVEARTGARYVKIIAEAVHHAHQRGILHRDLKPQNVLIDSRGEPRVTDFGLAKRTGIEDSLTRTAAIVGTPAYMPPEQAMGRRDLVGPHSDVYSLGAILYQLLTRKVPFAADNPLATLRKVMEAAVVAPTKLNANTPSDLETICLKCLEKHPERRYHSARELAEELDRFLNEVPILAQPPSRGRKVWNWTVQNPWALTGTSSILAFALITLAFGLWEQNQFLRSAQAHLPRQRVDSLTWAILVGFGLLFGFFGTPLAFAVFVDRKRRNLPFKQRQYWSYGLIGITAVLGSLAAWLGLIREFSWGEFGSNRFLFGVMLAMATPGAWFGSLLLWHLGRHYQLSCYARENPKDLLLFPPKAQRSTVTESISRRQQRNRYAWALVLILAITFCYGPDMRSTFVSLTVDTTVVLWLVLRYRRTSSANRHLILFGLLWCFLGFVVQFLVFYLRRSEMPLSLAHQFLAVGLGVASAGVLTWLDGNPGNEGIETADLPGIRALKNRAFTFASFNSWLLFVLGLLLFLSQVFPGPQLFPWSPVEDRTLLGFLFFVCVIFPYQLACYFRASGAERSARLNSVSVSFAAIATLLLICRLYEGPKAAEIGVAVGLLLLAVAFIKPPHRQ